MSDLDVLRTLRDQSRGWSEAGAGAAIRAVAQADELEQAPDGDEAGDARGEGAPHEGADVLRAAGDLEPRLEARHRASDLRRLSGLRCALHRSPV